MMAGRLLAAKEHENRGGVDKMLARVDCQLAKESMNQPPDVYVPWSVFEWFIGICMTAFAASTALIFRYVGRHFKEDDDRFHAINTKLDIEHQETKECLIQSRSDLLAGQRHLADDFRAVRRVLDDILLKKP